jgi:hypothetical protein
LLFPDVVRKLTPTISGTFELTTLTLHTGEKARFQNSRKSVENRLINKTRPVNEMANKEPILKQILPSEGHTLARTLETHLYQFT